jgi:hypothetical protein
VRIALSLLAIVYVVGVGVYLGPSIWAGWSSSNAGMMVENVSSALPDALAWPISAFRSISEPKR